MAGGGKAFFVQGVSADKPGRTLSKADMPESILFDFSLQCGLGNSYGPAFADHGVLFFQLVGDIIHSCKPVVGFLKDSEGSGINRLGPATGSRKDERK
ncbi:hypothetical protein D3C86_1304510 [compost metagenome]